MKTSAWLQQNLRDLKRPVSASGIMNALRCERLFLYRNKWGIRPKVAQYSKSIKVGKLVHKLMKVGKDRVDEVGEEVIKEHGKLVERIRKGEDLTGDLARAAKELRSLYDMAMAIYAIFTERFPPKDYVETIGREMKLETEYQGLGFTLPLLGIVDWLVKDTRNGSLWIRDTKTTGQGIASVLTGFIYCIQCRFYRILCDQDGSLEKPSGFILDVIATPTIKLCGKDEKMAVKLGCTPFEAYTQRVKEWYELHQAKEDEDAMQSVAIPFSELIYNSEIVTAVSRVGRLWAIDPESSGFCRDQTRSTCFAYKKTCPYYPLCSTAEAGWPSLIEKFYDVPEKKGEQE